MEANPVRIIQYFDGTKQSLIPLFQRPYTWDKTNWSGLWEDIMAHYDSDSSTHFMGAVVSFPVKTVPVGVSKHLVIDGQQRLTTLAIILAAIRDAVDSKVGERIGDYLINRHYDGSDQLKLLPTHADRTAYKRLIVERVADTPNSRITSAYHYFLQRLKGSSDSKLIDAQRVLQTIEQSLQVVMINLGETDDPYLIFESLNAKGEPLTQADLVRNYVLMKFRHSLESGGEQERVYQNYWQPLEHAIGEKLPDFLRHYCMRNGSEVEKRSVYTAIKLLLSETSEGNSIESEVRNMAHLGDYYSRFLEPTKEADPAVARSLAAFVELNVTTCYPLLLCLFDSRARSAISDSDFKKCLLLIESFVVRRFICDVPTNQLSKLFVQWSGDYCETNVSNWLMTKMASGNNNTRWPTDSAFEASFLTSQQYGGKATRHVLSSIEKSFGHKEAANLSTATIEHIMPQDLSQPWVEMLGSDSTEVHESLLHTFGNLTLTAYNSELGNLPFEEKRDRLARSHIELNHWISMQSKWSKTVIEDRAAELAKIALKLWPGPE